MSHNKLLHKHGNYGLRDHMHKWFETFLLGRQQCVKVGDGVSSWINVTSGIPQGSVCGPILFNLYVNDMPDCILYSKGVLYADGARLYIDSFCDNANES